MVPRHRQKKSLTNSDIGNEYQLSDLGKRNAFVGFEEDAGVLSAEEEEISDEEGGREREDGEGMFEPSHVGVPGGVVVVGECVDEGGGG